MHSAHLFCILKLLNDWISRTVDIRKTGKRHQLHVEYGPGLGWTAYLPQRTGSTNRICEWRCLTDGCRPSVYIGGRWKGNGSHLQRESNWRNHHHVSIVTTDEFSIHIFRFIVRKAEHILNVVMSWCVYKILFKLNWENWKHYLIFIAIQSSIVIYTRPSNQW